MILIGNTQFLGRSDRWGKFGLWSPSLGRSGKVNTLPPKKEKKKTATVEQNTCLLPYLPVLYSYAISVEGQYSVPFFVQGGEEKGTHTHTEGEGGRLVFLLPR